MPAGSTYWEGGEVKCNIFCPDPYFCLALCLFQIASIPACYFLLTFLPSASMTTFLTLHPPTSYPPTPYPPTHHGPPLYASPTRLKRVSIVLKVLLYRLLSCFMTVCLSFAAVTFHLSKKHQIHHCHLGIYEEVTTNPFFKAP